MIDTEAKLFWDRLKEWFWNMADEAGNLIYTDESKEMVDIINLLLLGWILLGLIVYILGNIIATQLRKRKQKELVTPTSESVSPYTTDSIAKSESVSSPVEDVPLEVLDDDIAVIKSKSSHVPVCSSGDSKFVSWINDVLSWVYSRGVVSPIREAWLSALNARTRMSSMEHGFLIDFKDIIPSSQAPDFVDVFAVDSEGMKELIHCQANARTLGFEVEVTQFKEKEKNTFPVILNVKELSGKLGIDVYPEDLLFTIKLLELPQVKVELDADALDSFPVEDRTAVQDVICDIVNDAISTAVVQIRLSSYSECPRISSYQRSTETEMADSEIKGTEERLLVKVVKAENLGSDKGCLKPYCIIEMDDPPQKFETSEAEHETSPIWNESFVFTVKEVNAELLFEIYDKERKDDFLGLGIVSLEELLRNPNQKLTIPLQERPLENDLVTGTLTAEFLFLDRNDSESTQYHSDLKNEQIMKSSKIVETNSRVTAGGTVITTTTIKRTNEDSEDLKDTALKELEKQGKPAAPSKSTLIIHSVQREIIQPTMKVKMDKSGNWQEVSEPETSGPDSLEASPASRQSKDSHSSHPDSMSSSVSKADDDDRSRPKEKKTFIGTLRKRLSFRKPRSKSAEIKQVESASMYSQGSNRSASSDRVKHIALSRETASLKSARRFLAVPGGSTRSSLSEASGLSTSSTRTYINENSTLVVETNENGIIKRYLIPPVLINRSKWRKRGLKLHIYNEHTFIAKHFSGSTICQVCKKALSRRPGKQGYICRDCSLQCHKSCHVKVPEFCPSSTTSSMEVEYECDPALAKKKK